MPASPLSSGSIAAAAAVVPGTSPRLPPTLLGPVVAGTDHVTVEGLEPGELFIVEACTSPLFLPFLVLASNLESAVGGLELVELPFTLVAGDYVRVRRVASLLTRKQRLGAGNPVVQVLPFDWSQIPNHRPRVPNRVQPGTTSIVVSGCAPGSLVEVHGGGSLLGSAYAYADGTAVVPVSAVATDLYAVFKGGGFTSQQSFSPREMADLPPLIHPVFQGDEDIVVSNVLEADTLTLLHMNSVPVVFDTSFPVPGDDYRTELVSTAEIEGSDGQDSVVRAPSSIAAPDLPATDLTFYGDQWIDCESSLTPLSTRVDVRPPEAGAVPRRVRVREPVLDGEDVIYIDDVLPADRLTVHVGYWDDVAQDVVIERTYEDRSAPRTGAIALPKALVVGDYVTVTRSDDEEVNQHHFVEVVDQPEVVDAPAVFATVHSVVRGEAPTGVPHCGAAVRVLRVVPGADVNVYQDGSWIGSARAGMGYSVEVQVLTLTPGAETTAEQVLPGGVVSPLSDPVSVVTAGERKARIDEPVAIGDVQVRVVGVTPGSRVSIFTEDGYLLGDTVVAESIAIVPVLPVPQDRPIYAVTRLCDNEHVSDAIVPIEPPSAAVAPIIEGLFGDSSDLRTVVVPSLATPERPTGEVPFRGEYYIPAPGPGGYPPNPPMVFILHGVGTGFAEGFEPDSATVTQGLFADTWGEGSDSFAGYRYLARALARSGFHVFSADYATVLYEGTVEQRGDYMLAALDDLRGPTPPSVAAPDGLYESSAIGLIGHSLGGGAAVYAEANALSLTGLTAPDIRAVVSIAGVSTGSDTYVVQSARLLVLLGSDDYFLDSRDATADWARALYHYDHAPAPKTFAFVHGATHQGFSEIWELTDQGTDDSRKAPATTLIDVELQRKVARDLIVSLMRVELLGDAAYGGYLEQRGLPPRSSYGAPMVMNHEVAAPSVVIDDFEGPDPAINTLGEAVTWTGPQIDVAIEEGLGVWTLNPDRVEHDELSVNVGSLEWVGPDNRYTSDLGGVATLSTARLALSILQRRATYGHRDLIVELKSRLEAASLRLGAAGLIRDLPRHRVESNIDPPDSLGQVLQGVQLNMDAFLAVNPNLDLSNLQGASIRTDVSLATPESAYLWPGDYLENTNASDMDSDGLLLDAIRVQT